LHFTEIYFSHRLIKSEIKGYLISRNVSVLLKHSNGFSEKDDGVSKRIRSPRIRDQVIRY